MNREIKSESEFVREQFWFLLTLPIVLLKILFQKEKPSALAKPFSDFTRFIAEPKVTFYLITINVIVFILEVFYFSQAQLMAYVFEPGQLMQFRIAPMFASLFLHASGAHLLSNMVALFIFGRVVEMHFGAKKMLWIYFGSAVISSVFSALFGQGGIGASGAISGVIAVAVLYRPFYLTYIIAGIPIPIILIGWLSVMSDITGILVPQNDNIGHFAHLGGYLAVTLLAFALGVEDRKKLKKGFFVNIAFVAVAAAVWFFMG